MMHRRDIVEIHRQIEVFVREEGIEKWEVLATVRRLLHH
jgi:hypothetical protein